MKRELTVSLDGMGGDNGPEVVVAGAELASVRHPDVRFLFHGDEARLKPLLEKHSRLMSVGEIVHTDVSIAMDDKPSEALRRTRRASSLWRAIDAVKTGQAQVAVSAGNTGAFMAMAKVNLKTIPQIDRPALACLWPTMRGESIVLDVGATVNPDAAQLVQFAAMGQAYARALMGIERPTVGLLNIGEEDVKGTEAVKEAARLLRASDLPIQFVGFVEGDGIGKGEADVVVTDGFTGNIALKTAEGTARQVTEYLRQSLTRSLISKIGAFLAQGAFKAVRERMDPRAMNGGLFLGLNGLVVKSHGGTDAVGYASAIDVAVDVASADLVAKIAHDLSLLPPLGGPAERGALSAADEAAALTLEGNSEQTISEAAQS